MHVFDTICEMKDRVIREDISSKKWTLNRFRRLEEKC